MLLCLLECSWLHFPMRVENKPTQCVIFTTCDPQPPPTLVLWQRYMFSRWSCYPPALLSPTLLRAKWPTSCPNLSTRMCRFIGLVLAIKCTKKRKWVQCRRMWCQYWQTVIELNVKSPTDMARSWTQHPFSSHAQCTAFMALPIYVPSIDAPSSFDNNCVIRVRNGCAFVPSYIVPVRAGVCDHARMGFRAIYSQHNVWCVLIKFSEYTNDQWPLEPTQSVEFS